MKNKIWLITGISSGLGEALAQELLRRNEFFIGTFRKQEQVEAFNQQHGQKARAHLLDITQPASTDQLIRQIKSEWGRLDVLINNAGVGFIGAVEETGMEEAKALFETNFFGTLYLTQQVLPLMRKQGSGHIIQMSSQSGVKGFAGFGIYNASKFALEGLSEALAAEVAPLGIRVTLVEPGPFRTRFASSSLQEAQKKIEAYEATAGAFRQRIKQSAGMQEGDPQKAAKAIVDLADLQNPPLRLPLGKSAVTVIQSKLESVAQDLNQWKEVAEGAVFE